MAIRNIVEYGDDVLRSKAKPVTVFDERLWQMLDDMKDTLVEANGVGLAAPQIGVRKRVVVIDVGEGAVELINPEIIVESGSIEDTEGCLSFPGSYGLVTRPEKVAAKALDRHGKEFIIEGEGLLARALMHETDHLDGKLFIDLATRMLTPEELRAADEED